MPEQQTRLSPVPQKGAAASDAPCETGCCGGSGDNGRIDWLLWTSIGGCAVALLLHFTGWGRGLPQVDAFAHSTSSLLAKMWWGLALGILAVGLLSGVPREFIMSALGRRAGWNGLLRATSAGLLLDLCNHGILLVGMTLYRRGATLGQTMAFLIASPWNSLTLTLILISLIGLPWTLAFIAGSGLIGLISGAVFEWLVARLQPSKR